MCKPYSTCRHIYCDQTLLNLKYQENMFLMWGNNGGQSASQGAPQNLQDKCKIDEGSFLLNWYFCW